MKETLRQKYPAWYRHFDKRVIIHMMMNMWMGFKLSEIAFFF